MYTHCCLSRERLQHELRLWGSYEYRSVAPAVGTDVRLRALDLLQDRLHNGFQSRSPIVLYTAWMPKPSTCMQRCIMAFVPGTKTDQTDESTSK